MIRDTSLVTNMDVKNTPNTKKSESAVICFKRDARPTTGFSTFSFLNPSSTHSIISSVPKVRQSISSISFSVGGVITMAMIAAKTDTVSMGSFFRNSSAFFIFLLPFAG